MTSRYSLGCSLRGRRNREIQGVSVWWMVKNTRGSTLVQRKKANGRITLLELFYYGAIPSYIEWNNTITSAPDKLDITGSTTKGMAALEVVISRVESAVLYSNSTASLLPFNACLLGL